MTTIKVEDVSPDQCVALIQVALDNSELKKQDRSNVEQCLNRLLSLAKLGGIKAEGSNDDTSKPFEPLEPIAGDDETNSE